MGSNTKGSNRIYRIEHTFACIQRAGFFSLSGGFWGKLVELCVLGKLKF